MMTVPWTQCKKWAFLILMALVLTVFIHLIWTHSRGTTKNPFIGIYSSRNDELAISCMSFSLLVCGLYSLIAYRSLISKRNHLNICTIFAHLTKVNFAICLTNEFALLILLCLTIRELR